MSEYRDKNPLKSREAQASGRKIIFEKFFHLSGKFPDLSKAAIARRLGVNYHHLMKIIKEFRDEVPEHS